MSERKKPDDIQEKIKVIYANWPLLMCIVTVLVNFMTSEIRGELKLRQGLDPIEKDLIVLKNIIDNTSTDLDREAHDLNSKIDRLEVYSERNYKKNYQK